MRGFSDFRKPIFVLSSLCGFFFFALLPSCLLCWVCGLGVWAGAEGMSWVGFCNVPSVAYIYIYICYFSAFFSFYIFLFFFLVLNDVHDSPYNQRNSVILRIFLNGWIDGHFMRNQWMAYDNSFSDLR